MAINNKTKSAIMNTIRKGNEHVERMVINHAQIVSIAFIVLLVVSLGSIAWGVNRQIESTRLQEKVQLQDKQLVLIKEKMDALEVKMKKLDSMDQEVRQIVSGSQAGKAPQGGGVESDVTKAKDNQNNSEKVSVEGNSQSIDATAMVNQIYDLNNRAEKHLASFYTLRAILHDGGADMLREVQENISLSSSDITSTMPSIWPVKGVVTSTYGTRLDPMNGEGAFHEGIDIANDYGTPIDATAAGVVTLAGWAGGYGQLVEIDHGNGFVTRYGHASLLLVHQGESVTKGQAIALMGSTGKSTGSHTHYEVRINGSPVDPTLFMGN